jgi:hypothetical protein
MVNPQPPPLRIKFHDLEVRASDRYRIHISGFTFEGFEGGIIDGSPAGTVAEVGTIVISPVEDPTR